MRRSVRALRGGALLAGLFVSLAAAGEGLRFGQAFEAALAFDPGYRAAAHNRDAESEALPIAQGNLLPQVGLVVSRSESEGWRRFSNAQNQPVEVPLGYSSPQTSLTVRWPLVNLEGLAAVDQAEAQVKLAEQQFRADGLNLLDRLSAAYAELLAAHASQRIARGHVAQAEVIAAQARRREADGEGTRVVVAREAAALELARSRLVEAETVLAIAREGVRRITGLEGYAAPELPPDALPAPLVPASFEQWLDVARRSNPLLQARQWAVDVASSQVRRQRAGHAPRLDVVGSITEARNDALSTIGQSSQLRSLGVQLQVPLFSGGTVQASVRQAQSRLRAAEEELRRERGTLELELGRAWQQMLGSEARVRALRDAVSASALALEGSRRSREEGLSTSGDEAALRASDLDLRRQLVQARLDLMLARVRLQIRAGLPVQEIVDAVEALWPAAPAPGPSSTS
ncbi:MAG: TolC family protein [Rhodoferax sp.]|nr:TolC family protein [Rhodoferax sp.]MCL4739096.1 TolC family protein [Burkholderiaceae bacterium]MCP5289727.1 TolC family protein [Burkholderiaceae bacterium]